LLKSEDTFVAKRIICDHVSSVGGLQNIDASDKHLLLAALLPGRTTCATWKPKNRKGM